MRTTTVTMIVGLLLLAAVPASAEVYWGGFLQGLYGGRIDDNNPTETEYSASEARLQLRAEHFGDRSEMFGRLDFFWDGADSSEYDWELREGYLKFRLGDKIDVKVGRQILTWGTGDLIFINDVFAKDYRSFFIGRDDQYLKAPQTALRFEWYPEFASLNLVWSPIFEANRLPTGSRLSYFNPFAGDIVGTGLGDQFFFDPPTPEEKFHNSEIALRLQRRINNFATALYAYRGFYKNPVGVRMVGMTPVPFYPELNVYGVSTRGPLWGGILWLEAGYMDSRQDRDGDNPMIENSSFEALAGFERQIATNLTVNLQWQLDYMLDHDTFESQSGNIDSLEAAGVLVRDELRHLLTSRITKLLWSETLTLSGFVFYSPTDEDAYIRASAEYKYTDEIAIMIGGNIFTGNYLNTEFGQFQKNDNAYLKITYGF